MPQGHIKKVDLKKALKGLYAPSAKAVEEVTVPPMTYVMIDGEGDPATSKDFAAAVEAMFAVSYTVKFRVKKGASGTDYAVMPLEGLWWADDMREFSADRSRWKWTAMIMQPSFVTRATIDAAIDDVKHKKALPALSKLRVGSLKEGPSAQTLHVGPFSAEGPTIARVHEFIKARGKTRAGKHHEIYLSDIRKVPANKWKTVIRQPMQ